MHESIRRNALYIVVIWCMKGRETKMGKLVFHFHALDDIQYVTVHAKIKHMSAKIFFELAIWIMKIQRLMNHRSKFGADNPYIC